MHKATTTVTTIYEIECGGMSSRLKICNESEASYEDGAKVNLSPRSDNNPIEILGAMSDAIAKLRDVESDAR